MPTARSYRDAVRGFRGRFDHPPDVVAHPRDEAELAARAATGRSEPARRSSRSGAGRAWSAASRPRVDPERYAGVVTIDLKALDRVLEVDPVSLSGPDPGRRDRPGARGAAARARAHPAPLPAVVSVLDPGRLDRDPSRRPLLDALHAHRRPRRVSPRAHPGRALGVAPAARLGRRGLPRPDADRLGGDARGRSPRPGCGCASGPRHRSLGRGALPGLRRRRRRRPRARPVGPVPGRVPARRPVRGRPDRRRGRLARAARARVRVRPGHESTRWLADRAGVLRRARRRGRGTPAGTGIRRLRWRAGATPSCARPTCATRFVAMGVLSETFETAITWERFPAFHARCWRRRSAAVREVCGAGSVTCRFTHVYPDGAGPVLHGAGPGSPRRTSSSSGRRSRPPRPRRSSPTGGTITHHHAVGRDHRPWYDRQRPEPFALALRGGQGGAGPERRAEPRGPDRPLSAAGRWRPGLASARARGPAARRPSAAAPRRRARSAARRRCGRRARGRAAPRW